MSVNLYVSSHRNTQYFEIRDKYNKLKLVLFWYVIISASIIVGLLCYIKYQSKCISDYQELTSILLTEDK